MGPTLAPVFSSKLKLKLDNESKVRYTSFIGGDRMKKSKKVTPKPEGWRYRVELSKLVETGDYHGLFDRYGQSRGEGGYLLVTLRQKEGKDYWEIHLNVWDGDDYTRTLILDANDENWVKAWEIYTDLVILDNEILTEYGFDW
jgi:hypothetical protein